MLGKALSEIGLRLLSSQPCAEQAPATAFRAVPGKRYSVATVMAVQPRRQLVQGHAGVAVSTSTRPAAVMTRQRIGESAAIQKKQYLIALI